MIAVDPTDARGGRFERGTRPEADFDELREHAHALEEEVVALRRRLQDAPKRVRTLEERLLEAKGQLAQAVSQNEKLSYTLRESREHIAALREEVEKLTQPPSAYGTLLDANDDGTLDVSDPIFGLSALFVTGSALPALPYPDCGADPTLDALDCPEHPACP